MRFKIAGAFVVAMLAIMLPGATKASVFSETTVAAQVSEFVIRLNSTECIDLDSASRTSTVRLVVAPCSNSPTQRFEVVSRPSTSFVSFRLVNSRCVESPGTGTNDILRVTSFGCDFSPEQNVGLAGGLPTSRGILLGPITIGQTGMCFDASDRPWIKQRRCDDSASQLFQLKPFQPAPTTIGSGPNADEQFWDLVKNSTKAADFQSYLNAFPSGQFAALARFNRDKFSGTSTPTGGGATGTSTVDEQFWDSVKNSQRSQDFQSYLDNFPNGRFAALARFNRDKFAGTVTPTGGGSSTVDEQFWDSVKNSQRSQDFQSYLDNFPNGRFTALARFNRDKFATTVPTRGSSNNATFLNQWASDTRAKLPVTSGNVQLVGAVSLCPSGCQQTDKTDSLLIRARTPNHRKQNITIGQIERDLKPELLKEYCTSPGNANNVALGVDVDDMNNQRIGNFFLNSRDCTGNTGTVVTPPAAKVLPSGRTEAQLMAAAQIGSLSEIAKSRNFFITADSLDAKTNINDAIRKELPQIRAATSQSNAEFFIGVNFNDRTTGAEVDYDANNPNLRGEMIVFTVTQWVNNSPFNIRIHFRVVKDRNFGVFSDPPEVNGAKEFAKQFVKVIVP